MERSRLVKRLKAHGTVTDEKVLEAMGQVPRHEFLPSDLRSQAYVDSPLPIGMDQTISAPHMVGIMLEELELRPGHKVLEIGGGSGYHAALMGYMVRPDGIVYTVERLESLGKKAEEVIDHLGYNDVVKIVIADGSAGLAEHAPYDRITVAAAAPGVPKPLEEQLADGGRMLVPVGGRGYQDLMLVTRNGDRLERTSLGGVVFVPLIGEHGHEDHSRM
ncbi:MAG: protein-L-isoaspartate O-methyltransferase [Euryarchaeota archaeon]|nr:protein-L-isoaspartate O-methyltransferase [Euryarchaeota archaeon]